jgi:stress response protein YsnF
METSNYSSIIDWKDVIKKEARGINDADLGEVQEVQEDYIVIAKGIVNREKFYIPRKLADGYKESALHFNLTEEQMKEKYSDASRADILSKKTTEEIIPLTEERLNVSKKESIEDVKVIKESIKETKTVPVQLTHEEIVIEVRNTDDVVDETDNSSGKEITNSATKIDIPSTISDEHESSSFELTIPIQNEIIEVSKQPYVKEEVVVRKKSITETRIINEQLKSERIVSPATSSPSSSTDHDNER